MVSSPVRVSLTKWQKYWIQNNTKKKAKKANNRNKKRLALVSIRSVDCSSINLMPGLIIPKQDGLFTAQASHLRPRKNYALAGNSALYSGSL